MNEWINELGYPYVIHFICMFGWCNDVSRRLAAGTTICPLLGTPALLWVLLYPLNTQASTESGNRKRCQSSAYRTLNGICLSDLGGALSIRHHLSHHRHETERACGEKKRRAPRHYRIRQRGVITPRPPPLQRSGQQCFENVSVKLRQCYWSNVSLRPRCLQRDWRGLWCNEQ